MGGILRNKQIFSSLERGIINIQTSQANHSTTIVIKSPVSHLLILNLLYPFKFQIIPHFYKVSKKGQKKVMGDQESELTHRRVFTNGIWLHVVEKGQGPPVLLIHGFPELWLSWTNQIHHLANHGYRVIVPDMRGYGDSDSPPDSTSYTLFHLVGDLIGLLDDLGLDQVFVVGHDWGAQVAWYLCLFRPDRVKALVNLGLPYRPSSKNKPTHIFSNVYGDGFYITQFQEPGRAEKSFAKYECLTILKKFLLVGAPDLLAAPTGVEIIDFLQTPSSLPPWISPQDLDFMASKFEISGFTGPLNYYRAMDLNWELLGAWEGAKITVPTNLIVGDKDVGFESFGTKDYLKGDELKSLVPKLEVVIIDGHHFIQLENAQIVNHHITSFFSAHNHAFP